MTMTTADLQWWQQTDNDNNRQTMTTADRQWQQQTDNDESRQTMTTADRQWRQQNRKQIFVKGYFPLSTKNMIVN
jgi:hypothetical protein